MTAYAVLTTYVFRNAPIRTAILIIIMLIFFKFVFMCPCTTPEQTRLHCWLYLSLPVGILFFLLMLMDTQLLKTCGSPECCSRQPVCCGQYGGYCCAVVWKHVLGVCFLGSVWMVVVFMEGGWYVCLRTVKINETGEQIACKEFPTKDEAETLRRFESESRVIGLLLILGLSFLLSVSVCLKSRWKPYYKSLYETQLEWETAALLEDKLHEKAVERAKHVIEHSLQSESTLCVNTDGAARYQRLGNAEEDVWHKISDPAFHLKDPL
ncbi:hypothetical protein DNTS_023455 [Danionella cerebrum]|uniref:Uncharacterized protein n=1 Tax=Danionella cerebrum TaxID=2873325 RepID=A0A553QUW3_9TELE|nr:hypothetical protein DNTS_023455 [Danionella translucida]